MQAHPPASAGSSIAFGATFGGLAVILGAFAAHAMKEQFDAAALHTFETGVRYQMYHALALVLIGLIGLHRGSAMLNAAGWSMVAGTALFSGSLYILALSGVRWLGAITPLGGVAFLVGWVLLAIAALRL